MYMTELGDQRDDMWPTLNNFSCCKRRVNETGFSSVRINLHKWNLLCVFWTKSWFPLSLAQQKAFWKHFFLQQSVPFSVCFLSLSFVFLSIPCFPLPLLLSFFLLSFHCLMFLRKTWSQILGGQTHLRHLPSVMDAFLPSKYHSWVQQNPFLWTTLKRKSSLL